MEPITKSILRFNFSEDIMDMIAEFAKLHRFDDRHTYKEHWTAWFEENNDELETLENGAKSEAAAKITTLFFRGIMVQSMVSPNNM